MKKIARPILIFLLFFTTYSAFAQWSVKVDGEYMFPLGQSQLDSYIAGLDYESPLSSVTGPLHGSYGSFGQGWGIGLAVDYTFKSNITLEIGGRYWHGTTSNFDDSSLSYPNVRTLQNYILTSQNINFYTISPSILYEIKNKSKFIPFIGVGLDIAFDAKMNQTQTYVTFSNNGVANVPYYTSVYNNTTTYNIALGATGQLGVKYKLNHRFNIFGGVQIDGLALMPDVQTLNSEVDNGSTAYFNAQSTNYKVTDYVKSIPTNANTNPNQPALELGQTSPASTWSIFLGLEIKFGSVKKSEQ